MTKEINSDFLDRYKRHILIKNIGGTGQKKLINAKILLIGLGGIGSSAIQHLAASGFGSIGIADKDTVALSNLQRQTIYGFKDIGEKKVDIAEQFVKKLNQNVKIEKYDLFIDNPQSAKIISEYDLILDGTDNVPSRIIINRACIEYKKPLIFGGVSGWEGAVSFFPKDSGACYECVFPSVGTNSDDLDCSNAGVLGVTTAMVGNYMAAEAIKFICDAGKTLSNKLLIIDCLNGNFETFSVKKNMDCPACKFQKK
jgi:molybdopterin/thiamine biosynthesis adenylyltransferase